MSNSRYYFLRLKRKIKINLSVFQNFLLCLLILLCDRSFSEILNVEKPLRCGEILLVVSNSIPLFHIRNKKKLKLISEKDPTLIKFWEDTRASIVEAHDKYQKMGMVYKSLMKLEWGKKDLILFENLKSKREFFAEGFLSYISSSFQVLKTVLENGDVLFLAPTGFFILIKKPVGEIYKGSIIFNDLKATKIFPLGTPLIPLRP
jgi:hypothetical protein